MKYSALTTSNYTNVRGVQGMTVWACAGHVPDMCRSVPLVCRTEGA